MPELRVPSLADGVVVLRPWRETDVPAQLEAFSDPFFHRFSDWAPQTEAAARAHLDSQEHARRRGEQIELALVEPHDDNVVLGGGSLNNVDLQQGRAAIGYWLAPHARGRGVATHAVRCRARRSLLLGVVARHDPHARDFLAYARVGIDDVDARAAAEPARLGLADEDARALRPVGLLDPDLLAFVKGVHDAGCSWTAATVGIIRSG
jgi:hypothetical protein